MSHVAAPALLARRDLPAGTAIGLATMGMLIVTGLDLIDGTLGWWTSCGVIMAGTVVPLAVFWQQLWISVFMPPLLLLGALAIVVLIAPDAVSPEGMPATASKPGRVLAGTVDRGIPLAIAEVLTLAAIGVRRIART